MRKFLRIPIFVSIISLIPLQGITANFASHGDQNETLNSRCMALKILDPDLILNVITTGSKTDLHISFNGAEGATGILKIYNASDQLVSEFEIDLKSDPDYFSILLNEYAPGEYLVELTTSQGIHTSQITILSI